MSVDQMSLFTALLALVALGVAVAAGVLLCSAGFHSSQSLVLRGRGLRSL